jgi:hypothetical protein
MRRASCVSKFLTLFSALGCLLQPALASDADQWRWSDVDRVVAVGDIHGAYAEFVRLLQATHVVDESLGWTGGKTHLVSLGDLLDRGAESRNVMDLLIRLQSEAAADGGQVIVVAGNHELMNLIGDLRYVSRAEYKAFEAEEPASMRAVEFQEYLRLPENAEATEAAAKEAFDKNYPSGFFAHRKAFLADGQYGKWLTTLPAFVVVNDTAFVHGGLPPIVAATEPGELNKSYKAAMARYLQLWRELVEDGELPNDQTQEPSDLARAIAAEKDVSAKLQELIDLSELPVLGSEGPFWYRGDSHCRKLFAEPIIDASLANIGASNVVIGHTVTDDRRVHALHDEKVTMLDTGMLVSYYKGRPSALIIEGEQRAVQYLNPNARDVAVVNDYPEAYKLSAPELLDALQNGTVAEVDESTDRPRVRLRHNDAEVYAIFYPRSRKREGERELAAYAVNEMLGFDIVPATVERTINGEPGALQLVYPDLIIESQRAAQNIAFNGWCSMTNQFDLLHVWDTLLANTGRTTDNVIYRQDLWRLEAIEYSSAFANSKRLPRPIASGQSKLTLRPEVLTALRLLDQATLLATLDGLLDKKSIKALIRRRDALLQLAGE